MIKIKHTPFEGEPREFPSLTKACEELGLKLWTVEKQFSRLRQRNKKELYIWPEGKIERV